MMPPSSFACLPRYMGSQRSQMDSIGSLVHTHILRRDTALAKKHARGQARAVDMCSGSGAASRWLREHGWAVHSVDQEPYTWYWNYYAMHASKEELRVQQERYRLQHGLPENGDIVAWWNALLPTLDAPAYFERHYAPHEQCQRMYFMPHVAHWFDQALHWHVSQDWSHTPLLHAHFVSQVCNAMIRAANTSGTMKSFHAQWGGSTGHRLSDIQSVPHIEAFWTPCGPEGSVALSDATDATSMRVSDIVYFDPPASVQQFGSSYHLLNAFVEGHYKAPRQNTGHGGKSGILDGARSSTFSKKSTVEKAWNDWVICAQDSAGWLVVTYPKEGLLSTQRAAMVLHQNGRNTVSRHELEGLYVYIVKTNRWQSPQQFKRVFSKAVAPVALVDYCNPQKLAPRFSLARVASKINVYDQHQCVAVISKRYKVTWLKPPGVQDSAVWQQAQLSVFERFSQYLVDRQWLWALTALRDMRRQCKRKKDYQEHWHMLYHLAQAHGQRAMLARISALDWT